MDYAYVLRVAASKFPTRRAVLSRDGMVTFADLDDLVDRTARALAGQGLAGQTVASILLNEPSTIAVYLGLARIGAVSVPVNTRLTADERRYVVENAGASALVVDHEFAAAGLALRDAVDAVGQVLITNGGHAGAADLDELVAQQHSGEYQAQVPGDRVATVMYTSGTTGFPKGVMRTHDANLWNVANSALGSPRRPDDLEFFTLPIFGIGFMHFALPTLLAGGCLLLDRAFDPERAWELIARHRPSRIFLAPTMIDSMLAVPGSDRVDASCLEIIYSAYEFPEPLRRRALERFGDRFVYMYGLTEAQLTAAASGEFAAKPTSAGKPMGLMRLRIVDDTGASVPSGTVGEIALEGPAVMAGYLGLPDATVETLRDGWVYTGDLGYLDADGDVHFAGRKKEIIKTGGFTVDPVEVEHRLFELAEIREAAVVGVPDEHWGEMVVAFVVASPGATVDEQRVRTHCRERLADYKVPKAVRTLDKLPKNPTGKIERGRLRALWADTDRSTQGGHAS
jgi:acyl-CoA synthetase (AMP-forming)/AMP-acid ligase II